MGGALDVLNIALEDKTNVPAMLAKVALLSLFLPAARPRDAPSPFRQACICYHQEAYQDALALYQLAIRTCPTCPAEVQCAADDTARSVLVADGCAIAGSARSRVLLLQAQGLRPRPQSL